MFRIPPVPGSADSGRDSNGQFREYPRDYKHEHTRHAMFRLDCAFSTDFACPGSAHPHGHSETTKSHRKHAKRRLLSRPSSASSRGGAHVQPTHTPALQKMWTHQVVHAIMRPYACFCFYNPIEDE